MQQKHDNTNGPQLCVVCNRFYGNPEKEYMCSACYMTHAKQQTVDKSSEDVELLPAAIQLPNEETKQTAPSEEQKQVHEAAYNVAYRLMLRGAGNVT